MQTGGRVGADHGIARLAVNDRLAELLEFHARIGIRFRGGTE